MDNVADVRKLVAHKPFEYAGEHGLCIVPVVILDWEIARFLSPNIFAGSLNCVRNFVQMSDFSPYVQERQTQSFSLYMRRMGLAWVPNLIKYI